jgi:hypothetical protein
MNPVLVDITGEVSLTTRAWSRVSISMEGDDKSFELLLVHDQAVKESGPRVRIISWHIHRIVPLHLIN